MKAPVGKYINDTKQNWRSRIAGPLRRFAKPMSRKAHAGSNPASSAKKKTNRRVPSQLPQFKNSHTTRRDAGVVYREGLENLCVLTGTASSNLALSAILQPIKRISTIKE